MRICEEFQRVEYGTAGEKINGSNFGDGSAEDFGPSMKPGTSELRELTWREFGS